MFRNIAGPVLLALLTVVPADAFPGSPVLFAPAIVDSDRINGQVARDLTSYPDMTRWRLVRLQTDLVGEIFGANVREPETTGHQFGGRQTYFHEPDEGDPKRYLELNFFADASFTGLIGTISVAQTYGETSYYIGTRLSEADERMGSIDITLVHDMRDNWRVHLSYRNNDDLVNFYSLRRVAGTPYYLVIERNRGRRSYGEITAPDVRVNDGGPLVIADKATGIYAEIGPTIDYGLADFSFGDSRHGYALGMFSGRPVKAFRTEDGGESWQLLGIDPRWVAREIYFRDRDRGFLSVQFKPAAGGVGSAHGCALLKTDDGGRSWERLEQSRNDVCLYKIHFDRRGTAYGYGRLECDGKWQVLQSVDGGLTWRPFYALPDDLLGVSKIETRGDKVIVHSLSGPWAYEPVFVLNRDGQLVRKVATGYPAVKGVEFVSEKVIFANVRDELGQYLIRSTDGGASWFRILEGDFELLYAVSESEIAILLYKGQDSATDTSSSVTAVAYTSDGGRTWREGRKVRGLDLATNQASQVLDDGSKLVLGGNYILKLVPVTN